MFWEWRGKCLAVSRAASQASAFVQGEKSKHFPGKSGCVGLGEAPHVTGQGDGVVWGVLFWSCCEGMSIPGRSRRSGQREDALSWAGDTPNQPHSCSWGEEIISPSHWAETSDLMLV